MIFENERKNEGTESMGASRYFARFRTTEEANDWLSMQSDIVLMDANIGTVSRFGMPANKIEVNEVGIEYLRYPYTVGFNYRIAEHDLLRVYKSVNIDKFRKKWLSKNPDKECVRCLKNTSRRHLYGTSIGYLSFVRDKVTVIYKQI